MHGFVKYNLHELRVLSHERFLYHIGCFIVYGLVLIYIVLSHNRYLHHGGYLIMAQ